VRISQELLAEALSGRYAIERQVGGGRTATVFRATALATGRPVAIKVLRPELAASAKSRRFHQEIAFLRSLDHPNILPLLDCGITGPLLYFVSPFAEGGSLAGRLADTPQMPLDPVVAVARDVAAALDHAHARSILHRDITPGNILFDGDRVLVCDFGIARALEVSAPDWSSSGFVLGTPAYMSPEQARGIGIPDARSDIYSLACVVYEMLAGEPPFSGPTIQVIVARQAQERPRHIHIVRPDLPGQVEAALERALAKEPLRRPPTAGTFVAELAGPGGRNGRAPDA
jgi:serine/threonine-protein kinase